MSSPHSTRPRAPSRDHHSAPEVPVPLVWGLCLVGSPCPNPAVLTPPHQTFDRRGQTPAKLREYFLTSYSRVGFQNGFGRCVCAESCTNIPSEVEPLPRGALDKAASTGDSAQTCRNNLLPSPLGTS